MLRLIALGVLAFGTPAAAAVFHNHLEKSIPAADSTVAASPREIRLWFSEKVEPRFSSITVLTADSAKVEVGKARATDNPKSIAADVPGALAAGKYTVVWRTAGDDGHAVRGRFSFSVK